jgi:hypothetical protein
MAFASPIAAYRTLACTPMIVCALGVAIAGRNPPTAVEKKWPIAHRGASAYAPENTVPAFQLAAEQGATFVEFDLQLTKDRRIVCLLSVFAVDGAITDNPDQMPGLLAK